MGRMSTRAGLVALAAAVVLGATGCDDPECPEGRVCVYSHASRDGYGTRSFRDWAPGDAGFDVMSYGPEYPYEHIEVPGAIMLEHSVSVIYNRTNRGFWFEFDVDGLIVSYCVGAGRRVDLTKLQTSFGSLDDRSVGHRSVQRCAAP